MGFPGGSDGKVSAYSAGDPGSIPGSERSPGEGKCNPLQYCCQKNPRDRGARWATVHRVTKSQTQPKQLSTQDTQLELAIFHRNLEGHCSLAFFFFWQGQIPLHLCFFFSEISLCGS